jgi:hypothetical protein
MTKNGSLVQNFITSSSPQSPSKMSSMDQETEYQRYQRMVREAKESDDWLKKEIANGTSPLCRHLKKK